MRYRIREEEKKFYIEAYARTTVGWWLWKKKIQDWFPITYWGEVITYRDGYPPSDKSAAYFRSLNEAKRHIRKLIRGEVNRLKFHEVKDDEFVSYD